MIVGVLAGTSLMAASLAPTKTAFAADQLTVTAFGGVTQNAQRKIYFEPFGKKTGIRIIDQEYNGEAAKIRAMVDTKSVSWDVVEADTTAAIQMCADGVVEKIDWEKLGIDRSKFTGTDGNDCGVPSLVYSTVLAYDKDSLRNGPKTIADLYDLQKFPGKRGLSKTPFVNLEWALIADGVAVKDVYKVLNTPEGADRAFRKLDTIKKDVVWWQTGAQPAQLLADGQVAMTQAWNARISTANKESGKHFEIVWDGEALGSNSWVIPKGGPRVDSAYKFIAFVTSPLAQAELASYLNVGPANKDSIQYVDKAVLSSLPTAPENMANALMVNLTFWADKGPELRERFTAWLAK
ncbi:ABC transporter substrate-binding protein [Bradyrhizobium sp. 87]|nr:ABC transporter substrate-binding protein [Bradyrhizobium sp. 87]